MLPPSQEPARLFSIAYISPQNHPIFVKCCAVGKDGKCSPGDVLKAQFAAHCALDIFDERLTPTSKSTECYLGLLYVADEIAIFGYVTPTKMKIVVAMTLTDAFIKDSEMTMIFKALHVAYYKSISNPFLRLGLSDAAIADTAKLMQSNQKHWKQLWRRVDEVAQVVGRSPPSQLSIMF